MSHTVNAYPEFKKTLYDFYQDNRRDNLPWRKIRSDGSIDPYLVYVSEVMLQQTQVNRVIPVFEKFIRRFPDCSTLSRASLSAVLDEWRGLGYNRRAKYLRDGARKLMDDNDGEIPNSIDYLHSLPGIGKNTAGAIVAYSFNEPSLFIETNIRTVYIHHFFNDQETVKDAEIIELLAATLDVSNPRDFYFSLMDYGTYVKTKTRLPHRKSDSYSKQTAFSGSLRQLRARVLFLVHENPIPIAKLQKEVNDPRSLDVVRALQKEGFIFVHKGRLTVAE